MAGSRLEKVGTIYTRASGLIRTGAINWEDRPLWYDVYEAFPPKEEPRFDRPAPNVNIKNIFYKEDKIRAIFHRNNKHLGTSNLFNNKYKSLTQKFVDIYQELEMQAGGSSNAAEEHIYKEAIEVLKQDKEVKKDTNEEELITLSSAFREARSAQKKNEDSLKLNISNIFKD